MGLKGSSLPGPEGFMDDLGRPIAVTQEGADPSIAGSTSLNLQRPWFPHSNLGYYLFQPSLAMSTWIIKRK